MTTDIKTYLEQAPQHIKVHAGKLADAIISGANAVDSSLRRLDDSVLQKQIWLQFASEYAKELYKSGIQQYADGIIRECSGQQNGRLQCVSGGFLYTGLGGLNAANPLFYVKSVYLTCVTVLHKDGLLSVGQAQLFRSEFELAFLMADIAKIDRLLRNLDETTASLQGVRRTATGEFDKRFKATRAMLKLMREALRTATSKVGAAIVEWKKLQSK